MQQKLIANTTETPNEDGDTGMGS